MVNVYTVDVIMKNIILVGATSGVGLGFIESQFEKDVFITCLYRDENKLDKLKLKFTKHLEKLSFIKIDISDVPNIENTIKSQLSETQKYDAMVFCAGKSILLRANHASHKKVFDIMNVNYFSFVELLRVFVNKYKKKDGVFKIVAVSSMASKVTTGINAIYGSSKAALETFIRSSAKDLSKNNVLINAIAPAYIDTDMINNIRVAYTPEEFEKYIKGIQCLGLIPVNEIAAEIDYLLWTSNFVTGTVRSVNAGFPTY